MTFLELVAVFGFICLAVTRDAEGAGGAHRHRQPCGVNEEFKECQSSSCAEWRCGEVRGSLRPCTADCQNACFCAGEHYRHPNGTCVPHEQCRASAVNETEGTRAISQLPVFQLVAAFGGIGTRPNCYSPGAECWSNIASF
ncbi:hypothetical protein HPB49_020680 [Dermacentor silvarum]|uniref:Uncharacterized protein n=1 Tax=Dermacentor silvarum TaxID=543639 RepID=A0ACB8CT50_DERSI|nr:hypothetical protein HPB49_020680 [Dermacentor silvarum]